MVAHCEGGGVGLRLVRLDHFWRGSVCVGSFWVMRGGVVLGSGASCGVHVLCCGALCCFLSGCVSCAVWCWVFCGCVLGCSVASCFGVLFVVLGCFGLGCGVQLGRVGSVFCSPLVLLCFELFYFALLRCLLWRCDQLGWPGLVGVVGVGLLLCCVVLGWAVLCCVLW